MPPVNKFPKNSLEEWSLLPQRYPYCALRQASAYVLVYDASKSETFQYVKQMRTQIQQANADTYTKPILVVGSKQDLVSRYPRRGSNHYDPANVVRKQWRYKHCECSAKYNWKVSQLFREITCSVDGSHGPLGLGVDVSKSTGNSVHQHLSHLPHLAQLAHLGNLNLQFAAASATSATSGDRSADRSSSANSGSSGSANSRLALWRRLLCRVS